jgi:hypothetical protein
MTSKTTDNNKHLYEKDYCSVHSYRMPFPRRMYKSFYIKQVKSGLEGLYTKGMRILYTTVLGRNSAHISQIRTSYSHITVLYTELKA